MNLKNLSDETLHFDTKSVAREEHRLLSKLLHHIKENERRRLFSKYKYESIHQYVEKELGYSNDEAWRRVSASRLLAEIPEIEEMLGLGELNLTTLGMAQSTLPVPQFREQVRVLDNELCEYNFAADQETQVDIERLKGLLAHSHPGI